MAESKARRGRYSKPQFDSFPLYSRAGPADLQRGVPFEHAALIKVKSGFREEQVQTSHCSNLASRCVGRPGKAALDTVGLDLD